MTRTRRLFKYFIRLTLLLLIAIVTFIVLVWYMRLGRTERMSRIRTWFANPAAHSTWQVEIGSQCANAPMLMPSTGYIGLAWKDGFWPFYQHWGFDIFSPDGENNVTPIIAAYDGYLTREANWRSAVIIRHPDFPVPALKPPKFWGVDGGEGHEQIWTYYAHMASTDGETSYISPDFPPGTHEKFVKAGTLLGYQGTWSGNPERATGLHLHFSVVKSTADGGYANETQISNTYDPAPFLGVTVDEDGIYRCQDG